MTVKPKYKSGFSLLELIVVLVLLTIIAASIVPIYTGSLSKAELDRIGSEIESLLNHASERAVTGSTEYKFNITIEDDKSMYWLSWMKDDGTGNLKETIEDRTDAKLPEDIYFGDLKRANVMDDDNGTIYYFSFYPNGLSDEVEISLLQENGTVYTITKSPSERPVLFTNES